MCKELDWDIKLDVELADRESEAWDMDRSLGWQGSSVPEDRTEAGVRCCFGRWVDLTCLFPLSWLGLGLSVRKGFGHWQSWGREGWTGGEDPGVLTYCLEPLWAPLSLQADEQAGLAGRMVLGSWWLC